MPVRIDVGTRADPDDARVTWRYREGGTPAFDPVVFDEAALAARDLIAGRAAAGRGGAVFFRLGAGERERELVLRHYRRGGLFGRVIRERYLNLGLERSRPMCEFALLLTLERLGLPAPVAFAARRISYGAGEGGSLVTHRLPGATLAERLIAGSLEPSHWRAVGECVARFHLARIRHADLNAHNLLVTDDARVSMLDFDRGVRVPATGAAAASGPSPWARANVHRLLRSVDKIVARGGLAPPVDGIRSMERAWRDSFRD